MELTTVATVRIRVKLNGCDYNVQKKKRERRRRRSTFFALNLPHFKITLSLGLQESS